MSRGRESVNRSLRRCPGFSTILTGSPLCFTASLNLRLVASLMKESFRMAVLSLEVGVLLRFLHRFLLSLIASITLFGYPLLRSRVSTIFDECCWLLGLLDTSSAVLYILSAVAILVRVVW